MFSNFVGVSEAVTGKVENDPNTYKTVQAIIISAFVIFPLSLTKKMSGLRYISMLSVGSMVYIILMLFFQFPGYYQEYTVNKAEETFTTYFTWDFSNFFNAIGVIYFAYTNQSQLLPIYAELANPQRQRVTKVIFRSAYIVAFFYTAVPFLGYLSTLNFTPTVIVTRPMLHGEKDYFQIIAVFAVMAVLFVKILTMIMPFKLNLY